MSSKPCAAALLVCSWIILASCHRVLAELAPNAVQRVSQRHATEHRVLWTASRIHGTPEPRNPYRTENAFPQLKFYEPLEVTVVPGSDRLAVAERPGKIFTFVADPANGEKELLVDVGRMVYGLAFHPRFAENGYVFVTSILDPDNPSPRGSRLSRFEIVGRDPLRADRASETIILEWLSGGHNGGCIRFGPDGYLYLATGDGSGIADGHKTGQDTSDLLASILRIDVDRPSEGRAYGVPDDNPFVGVSGARPEIWSYGNRQVWKFSFDTLTGDLWAGDVGQDLWEMIYQVFRGGNYGWSVNEGSHPFRPVRKKGPTPILPPVVEQSHSDFRSITGGYVYRGDRRPELRGAYIYGDYDTGKIWSFRYDNHTVTDHRQLADTQLRIVAFGQDTAGEVYALDFMGGGLHRLVPAPPAADDAADFPRKLSETGLFTSTKDMKPAPGLISYSVNAPLWSDGAKKGRYLALPGDSQIEYNTVVYPQPAPGAQPGWRFPDGTVLVKTFSLEMETGNPDSLRHLETRILHLTRMPGTDEVGAQYWRGYTYLWNDDQTDAALLGPEGLDRSYAIKDARAPGGQRSQVWHFPSRAECTLCHTMPAKYALGVNTLQMNKDHDYGGKVVNQLRYLDQRGIFAGPLPEEPEKLPRLVDYRQEDGDLNLRARSYLHANCGHCHRKWGGGNAAFQLVASLALKETATIDASPGHGRFDLTQPHILAPGDPRHSMIHHRMRILGLGRMPHIGSNLVDQDAVNLIAAWIEGLPEHGEHDSTGVVK